MFRELQHRVSNNLQVAAGLLALQRKHVEGDRARAALEEASMRIGVIGRISRQLYESDGGTRNMHDFLEQLCADVVEMSGRAGIGIGVHAGQEIRLTADAALPLALVVAEAVANAIEHGFADRETGTIDVTLARDPAGQISVEIVDDGCGLPEGFDLATNASLGLRIARDLRRAIGRDLRDDSGRADDRAADAPGLMRSGGSRCPAPRFFWERSRGFCCPAPLVAAGIRFCCPVRSNRAFV